MILDKTRYYVDRLDQERNNTTDNRQSTNSLKTITSFLSLVFTNNDKEADRGRQYQVELPDPENRNRNNDKEVDRGRQYQVELPDPENRNSASSGRGNFGGRQETMIDTRSLSREDTLDTNVSSIQLDFSAPNQNYPRNSEPHQSSIISPIL